MRANRHALVAAFAAALFLAAACGTVTPGRVEAERASYDGGAATSGVVEVVRNAGGAVSGWVVTPRARDRYNALVEKYGALMWSPPVGRDYGVAPYDNGLYLMTDEAMAKFVAMAEVSRSVGK
jgi:hypothetical protein